MLKKTHVLYVAEVILGTSNVIKTARKVVLYDFFDGPLALLTKGQKANVYIIITGLTKFFFNGTEYKICFGSHRYNFTPPKRELNLFHAKCAGGGRPR